MYDADPDGETPDNTISGKVYGGKIISNRIAIYAATSANLVVEDMTVVQSTTQSPASFRHCALAASYGSTLTVNSGSYTGTSAVGIFTSGGIVNITGGTFAADGTSGNDAFVIYAPSNDDSKSNSELHVSGGRITGDCALPDGAPHDPFTRTVSYTGGTFSVDPKAYVASGYVANGSQSGWYTIQPKTNVVAVIGTAEYATLEAAVEAAKTGETIRLVEDIDFTETYAKDAAHVLDFKDNVTLDLDGKTITYNNFSVIYQGNNLTIKAGKFVAANAGSYALFVGDEQKTSGVVIEDVTCTGGINFYNTTATIKEVSGTSASAQDYYAVWCDELANVTIESGAYKHFAGNNVVEAYDGSKDITKKATLSLKGGVYSIEPLAHYVAEGYMLTDNTDAKTKTLYPYAIVEDPNVARIDDTKYATLAEAFAAVSDNGTATITVIKDNTISFAASSYVEVKAGQNITLDLNGKSIISGTTLAEGTQLIKNSGIFTVVDNIGGGSLVHGADPVWIYDGSGSYVGSYVSNVISNYGTLLLKSGYIKNISKGSASYVADSFGSSSATIEGGTYEAVNTAFRLFYGSVHMLVKGGSVSAGGYDIAQFTGNGGSNKLEITGGEFTTTGSFNVYSWAQTEGDSSNTSSLNISGGTFDKWVALSSLFCQYNSTISGGKFYAVHSYGGGKFVKGGLFEYAPASKFLYDGYGVFANTDAQTKDKYPWTVADNRVEVDPTTVQTTLDNLTTAATVVLAAGDYGHIYLRNNGTESNRILKDVKIVAASGANVTVEQIEYTKVDGKSLDVENLTIDGITFDLANQSAVLFDVDGGHHIRVNGLTVQNCTKVGDLSTSSGETGKYDNAAFVDLCYDGETDINATYACDPELTCGYHDIVVRNNRISKVYQPIKVPNEGPLYGITITGNTFDECNDNHLMLSSKTTGSVIITNNVIKNMTGRFARFSAAQADAVFTVSDNTVVTPKKYDTGNDGSIFKVSGAAGFTVNASGNQWEAGNFTSDDKTTWIAQGTTSLLVQ